jgi:hypothetical protein
MMLKSLVINAADRPDQPGLGMTFFAPKEILPTPLGHRGGIGEFTA